MLSWKRPLYNSPDLKWYHVYKRTCDDDKNWDLPGRNVAPTRVTISVDQIWHERRRHLGGEGRGWERGGRRGRRGWGRGGRVLKEGDEKSLVLKRWKPGWWCSPFSSCSSFSHSTWVQKVSIFSIDAKFFLHIFELQRNCRLPVSLCLCLLFPHPKLHLHYVPILKAGFRLNNGTNLTIELNRRFYWLIRWVNRKINKNSIWP